MVKNMDQLSAQFEQELAQSKQPFVVKMVAHHIKAAAQVRRTTHPPSLFAKVTCYGHMPLIADTSYGHMPLIADTLVYTQYLTLVYTQYPNPGEYAIAEFACGRCYRTQRQREGARWERSFSLLSSS